MGNSVLGLLALGFAGFEEGFAVGFLAFGLLGVLLLQKDTIFDYVGSGLTLLLSLSGLAHVQGAVET